MYIFVDIWPYTCLTHSLCFVLFSTQPGEHLVDSPHQGTGGNGTFHTFQMSESTKATSTLYCQPHPCLTHALCFCLLSELSRVNIWSTPHTKESARKGSPTPFQMSKSTKATSTLYCQPSLCLTRALCLFFFETSLRNIWSTPHTKESTQHLPLSK